MVPRYSNLLERTHPASFHMIVRGYVSCSWHGLWYSLTRVKVKVVMSQRKSGGKKGVVVMGEQNDIYVFRRPETFRPFKFYSMCCMRRERI
jgi:hypothetical protein